MGVRRVRPQAKLGRGWLVTNKSRSCFMCVCVVGVVQGEEKLLMCSVF